MNNKYAGWSRRTFFKLSAASATAMATYPLMANDNPNKQYAYVGSYTGFEPGQLPWVGSQQPGEGISSFLFNPADGSLSPTGKLTVQDSPTWLEIHPNGQYLVATHELSHHTGVAEGVGFVTSYKILPDGELEKIVTQETGGRGNTSATFDRTGRFLLVTRYWESGISVLPFDPDTGHIGEVTANPTHKGSGPDPIRQSVPHPHGFMGDPKTDLVYATDLGTDKVHQYLLDSQTGTLSPHGEVELASGSGPRGMKFHPSLRLAYVNCELDGTVVVCAIDDKEGLKPIQTVFCYPEDFVAQGHPENLGRSVFLGSRRLLVGRWELLLLHMPGSPEHCCV